MMEKTNQAHMVCFNSTAMERTLSLQLGIPLYANDPEVKIIERQKWLS